jgi:sulfur carrier protein
MIRVIGEQAPWWEGMTIRNLLEERNFTFPMIAVWVNGTPHKRDEFSSVKIPDGAEVQAIHMISGG